MANFRHVTKCRGGSGGDLPSFLPVRCLMLKLVHSQISKPWECHLYFAQGCHLNFALTGKCPIRLNMEIHINPVSLDQAGFLIDILLMAKVSVPRQMFADILSMIAQLRAPPSPSISFL